MRENHPRNARLEQAELPPITGWPGQAEGNSEMAKRGISPEQEARYEALRREAEDNHAHGIDAYRAPDRALTERVAAENRKLTLVAARKAG
jgi:hypothetical protein